MQHISAICVTKVAIANSEKERVDILYKSPPSVEEYYGDYVELLCQSEDP